MKDLDLVEGTNGKMRLAAGCKKRLLAELTADADFLAGLGVMDYSLLVRSKTWPVEATKHCSDTVAVRFSTAFYKFNGFGRYSVILLSWTNYISKNSTVNYIT